MKERAADESLSEENRVSAQKALDALVSAQIEQDVTVVQRKKKAIDSTKEAGQEMDQWLAGNRLLRFAEHVSSIAGPDSMSSDLVFLTEEDIDELGGGMTHIERMRLQSALEALREDGEQAAADAE